MDRVNLQMLVTNEPAGLIISTSFRRQGTRLNACFGVRPIKTEEFIRLAYQG